MQENTGIKKYVLTRQAHFGFTKQSYVGGTVFVVDFDKGKYTANGSSFNDLRDINIAVRAGFMDAFSETVKSEIDEKIKKQEEFYEKVSESKKEKPVKMEVIKSDEDLIDPIPIQSKKEEAKEEVKEMEIITENSEDTARGMTVLRSQPQELEESSQGTVVAVIGGNKNSSVKTANIENKPKRGRTKKSEEKAEATAEKRKQEALKKRESSKKSKEEK